MNETIFYYFYNLAHQTQNFDSLVVFLAETFPYLVVFSAGIFLLFYQKNIFQTTWLFLGVFFAWFLSFILKNVFVLLRPFEALPGILPLFSETGFALPSGHATFFLALAVAIFLVHKKVGSLFVLFALLIGIARIIAGVHFPFDILGGFLLGGIFSYLWKTGKVGPSLFSTPNSKTVDNR